MRKKNIVNAIATALASCVAALVIFVLLVIAWFVITLLGGDFVGTATMVSIIGIPITLALISFSYTTSKRKIAKTLYKTA